MTMYCTEACYYNDCGVCMKIGCPRFADAIRELEETEEEEEENE